MNSANFYRAFEEHCYAPRQVIKELREQYLSYVRPLSTTYPGAATFDVGCGRGEWLELMQSIGFTPFGMDLDAGMLQACHERGLPALQGDAIKHLTTLADHSQTVVSAFHVVEHIAFEQLQTLVAEAMRVLKPGGLLIMETPNPENVAVATRNFYLDPTHLKPLPPMLLNFLAEFSGFARVATLRLQEPKDIHTRTDITLTDVLHHVSPDYAVVAQKQAPAEVMQAFDGAFAQPTGVDLHNLANRFDERQSELMAAHHDTRQAVNTTRQQLSDTVARLDAANVEMRENFDTLQISLEAMRQKHDELRSEQNELRRERDNLLLERDALRNSLSWRITAPLRGAASFAVSPVSYVMGIILQNPQLSERINGVISRFPTLHERLRNAAIAQGMMTATTAVEAIPQQTSDLSPRAQQIHAALQRHIQDEA